MPAVQRYSWANAVLHGGSQDTCSTLSAEKLEMLVRKWLRSFQWCSTCWMTKDPTPQRWQLHKKIVSTRSISAATVKAGTCISQLHINVHMNLIWVSAWHLYVFWVSKDFIFADAELQAFRYKDSVEKPLKNSFSGTISFENRCPEEEINKVPWVQESLQSKVELWSCSSISAG